MRAGARLVVALMLLLVAGAAAACGDDDDDDVVDDLGGDPDDATTTTVDEEAIVLDAYYAGWDAFTEASANPVDPDHPALAETLIDPSLSTAQDTLRDMAEAGEYFSSDPIEHTSTVTDLSAATATIEDCVSDPSARHAADGSVISPGDPTPFQVEVMMVKEDGTWKRRELHVGDRCEL